MWNPLSRVWLLVLLPLGCLLLSPNAFAQTPPTVAVDVTSVSQECYDRLDGLALEKRLVLRLISEGFAVVSRREHPVVVVRLSQDGDKKDRMVLSAACTRQSEQRTVVFDNEPQDEVHLEISQKVVELVRQVVTPCLPSSSSPPAVPVERTRSTAPSRPTSRPARSPAVGPGARSELGLGLGTVVRGNSADVLLHLWASYLLDGRTGPHLMIGYVPSSEAGIEVQEFPLQAGWTVRLALGRSSAIDAGLLAGVSHHRFEMAGTTATQASGSRTDPVMSVPVSRSYSGKHMTLGVRIAPGSGLSARAHTSSDQVLWSRSAFRLESSAVVAVAW